MCVQFCIFNSQITNKLIITQTSSFLQGSSYCAWTGAAGGRFPRRLRGSNPAEIHFSTITAIYCDSQTRFVRTFIAQCLVTSTGTCWAITGGVGVGVGCILGHRDAVVGAIQPCPLSRTLDASPSLHSWEHLFFCVWAHSSLPDSGSEQRTAASNQPSCCSPEGLHQRSPALLLHAGNPDWHQ